MSCGGTPRSAGIPRSPRVRCRASSRCWIPASTRPTRTSRTTSCCTWTRMNRRARRAAASMRTAPPAAAVIRTAPKWPAPSAGAWTMASASPGVAPNSRLLPIVISRVDRGLLGAPLHHRRRHRCGGARQRRRHQYQRQMAGRQPRDFRSIRAAVGGDSARRRLLVTGYATSLDCDDIGPRVLPLALSMPVRCHRGRARRHARP